MVVKSSDDRTRAASDREKFAPPTDKELLGFMYRVVIAAILIPPFIGGFVAATAGFYPFPGFYYGLVDIIGIYVAIVLLLALWSVPHMHRTIVGLANSQNSASPEYASRTLFRFNAGLWLGISLYTVFGALVSDLSMQRLGFKEYNIYDHMRSQVVVFPVSLLASFPIFFIFIDKVGGYLAPRGVIPLAVSIRTKVLILGIVSPLLIDTILIGYFYNQTGYFSLETLGVWFMLLGAAAIGAHLAWSSVKQGIRPLHNFTSQTASLELGQAHEAVVPRSLDEFGILTANLNELEKRRFELTRRMREEREYSNTLLETMASVVVVLLPDGSIDYINPAFEKLSGRTLAEMKGKDWFATFIPESDQAQMAEVLRDAIDVAPTRANTNSIVTRTGELVEIEWSDNPILDHDGKVLKVIATGVDVTDRLAALRDLKISEKTLRAAERIAELGNWRHLETGDMIFSDGALQILGAADGTEHWTLASFLARVHPDDVEIAKATIGVTAKDDQSTQCICRMTRMDGQERIMRLELGSGSTGSGPEASKLGVFQDITETSAIQKKLRQSQKMEAVGNMTGGVAHDFNNHLAVILGNLELLRGELDNDSHIKLIDTSIDATLRGADLTKNMLSFARQADLQLSRVALNDVVGETQKWIGRTLPANIDVESSLLAGLWNIEADATSVESALLNLLLNARDAMPDGGKLTIETANVRVDEDYIETRSEDLEPGRYAMLAISDTGEGIDAETIKSIFDPFFTTKPPGAGSGLGLSMVEGFMKQSGGAVQVYSEPGVGTTFKLYFRALSGVNTAQDTKLQTTAKDLSKNARILLAEDEQGVQDVLVAGLEHAGYQITAVMTGDAALEMFRQDADFDLLITDITMPGELQGTTLAKALREIRPDLPVVFMSGYASEATVHGNGLRSEDIRLMKPVRQRDLVAAIEKALQR